MEFQSVSGGQVTIENYLKKCKLEGAFTHAAVIYGKFDLTDGECLFAVDSEGSQGWIDWLFDLASLTKTLCTGFLTFKTLGRNFLNLPLAEFLGQGKRAFPVELCDLLKGQRIDQLLGHRSDFPAWGNLWINRLGSVENLWENRDNFLWSQLNRVILTRKKLEPVYSDLGYLCLGGLLEHLSGSSLDVLFKRSVPRSVSEKVFFLPAFGNTQNRPGVEPFSVIPTGFSGLLGQSLRGIVHDENAASLGGVAGHAGLFGTAQGLVQLLRYFVFEDESSYFRSNAEEIGRHENDGLLGFRMGNGISSETFAEGRSIGHLGFTGTSFYIEPESKKFVVFLSNRVINQRVNPAFGEIRRKVHGLSWNALFES